MVQCDWDSENLVEYSTSVWNTITKVANILDADFIVTGTHSRTRFAEFMNPPVSHGAVKHGHRPVLIVQPEK